MGLVPHTQAESGAYSRDSSRFPRRRPFIYLTRHSQILRRQRGQVNVHFPCSADHEQDWPLYPVDPYSCYMCNYTYAHTYAIGSVPSLSGQAVAYRWRSLPRVRRHRASSPQGSSSNGCCHFTGHDRPINMRLSFPYALLVRSGHTYSKKSMDQLGKVANPAHGQLNMKNIYFAVRVHTYENLNCH